MSDGASVALPYATARRITVQQFGGDEPLDNPQYLAALAAAYRAGVQAERKLASAQRLAVAISGRREVWAS